MIAKPITPGKLYEVLGYGISVQVQASNCIEAVLKVVRWMTWQV